MVKLFQINVNCRFSYISPLIWPLPPHIVKPPFPFKGRFEIYLLFAFFERLLWRPRSWTLLPKKQKWPRCKIRGKRGGKNLQQFYSPPRRASGWQAKWLQFANSDISLSHLKNGDLYPVLQCFYFAILSSRTKLDTVFDVFLNLQEMLLNMYYVCPRRGICQKLILCQKKGKPYQYAIMHPSGVYVYKPYLHGFKLEMFVRGILRG